MTILRRALLPGAILTIMVCGLALWARPSTATRPAHRTCYLARGLSPEALVVLGAAIAVRGEDVLLLDSDNASPYLRDYFEKYPPPRLVAVGDFAGGVEDTECRLGVRPDQFVPWDAGPPPGLLRELVPESATVVVCPASDRRLLLQAGCLAAAAGAPLFVWHETPREVAALRECLAGCGTVEVQLVGQAERLSGLLPGYGHVVLRTEEAVASAYRKLIGRHGPIETAVVANPADAVEGRNNLSALAPWLAVQKRAALLLTGPEGQDVEDIVTQAARLESLRHLDAIILLADLQTVPWRHRPNPAAGKDPEIEMEPLTPVGAEPFSFAIGRLFHADPAVVPLTLARQRALAERPGPRKALVAANAGGGLALLETLSRNTTAELRNAGYQTTARFGRDAKPEELRRLLPEHDIFLWEGHHNVLMRDFEFLSWDEPLSPSFVFLQSCLALSEYKAGPLMSRGAVAVLGTSTRMYSASGGSCSLAFFDALLYDDQSLGGALRQSKNFLLACTQLKEKRLGKETAKKGAGLRAAWAFTLWGDPTLKLPRPERPAAARPPVRHRVEGNTIFLALPEEKADPVKTEKYEAASPANGRLAGLVRKDKQADADDPRPLVPLVFAEVALPRGHKGQVPRLTSKLPSSHWVFCWDARRSHGYLLAAPRPQDKGELRFSVHWGAMEAARSMPSGSGGR